MLIIDKGKVWDGVGLSVDQGFGKMRCTTCEEYII